MTPNPLPETAVLVIGAGPVGLTLANELRRRDVSVRIVDKAASIREISKALIWHIRTQQALDKIGILEHGRAEAQPLTEVAVHAYGKPIGSWHMAGQDSPHSSVLASPLIIGQNRTQHLLLDLLQSGGTEVEWNTEATAMQEDDTGVAVTLRRTEPQSGAVSEETVHAQYVVGCEGSNSLVRKTLGLTFEGERYSGEQFIQADCKIQWTLPTGRSYLFLTDDGYLMVIEMPGGTVRIFISLPDAAQGGPAAGGSLGAAEDLSHEPTLDEIHSSFVRLTGIEAELSAPTWLARYRTSHRYADKFSAGRAFVAGDAGHVHVPIGGQGMNTGIQDAFNLGWKLAGVVQGHYKPEVLDTYNAERHPVAAGLIRGTDRAYKSILHPSELQQRAARLFGPYLVRNETVQSLVRTNLEELNITYPDTPLSRDLGGSSGPKPGVHFVDAPVVRLRDKQTVTLGELTRHPGWTLLLFGGTLPQTDLAAASIVAPQVEARYGTSVRTYSVLAAAALPPGLADDGTVLMDTVLMDAEHYLHTAYGVTHPTLYLLRPDGYVGFRGPAQNGAALLAYLDGIFVPQTEK